MCLPTTSFGCPAPAAKCQLHTTDDDTVFLVHRPHAASSSQGVPTLPPPHNQPPRVYVPMLMRPWVLHTCYSTTSCHFSVARTLGMLRRFHWWIGMDISTHWWLRRCLKFQARKTSRQTIRWPTLSLPLPNDPGILVNVDYFGVLPIALGAELTFYSSPTDSAAAPTCTLLLRPNSLHLARLTSSSTATSLSGVASLLFFSDNGLQFCSKLSRALYERLGKSRHQILSSLH